MYCDECRKRPATVHVTKIINNQKNEMNLCEECARAKGETLPFLAHTNFSLQSLLSGLLESDAKQAHKINMTTPGALRCSKCGTRYNDFIRTGFFGCSSCYNQFEANLDPLLRRIHGSIQHTGKAPKRMGGSIRLLKEVEALRAELAERVTKEEYEAAAVLRDRIHELEEKIRQFRENKG